MHQHSLWKDDERPPPDAFDLAPKAALKALELDETVAEAHQVLAQLSLYDDKTWDWSAAERSLKGAPELNPALAATMLTTLVRSLFLIDGMKASRP